MKEIIKKCLLAAIEKAIPDFKGDIPVEIPERKENGDYSSNVAFVLSKILKKSPQAAAETLAAAVSKTSQSGVSDFSKIEAKNGFINFYLSPDRLRREIAEILKRKNKYGFSKPEKPAKIQVEFISANPTGPLTLGNGRGGFYGDVLANVLLAAGQKVSREYYINDRGEQILNLGRSILKAQGGARYSADENLYKGGYINDLARKIKTGLGESEAGKKAARIETFLIETRRAGARRIRE